MDELLIEDKKYISSKRAAKMTGYAKDYIGQLCREGRVPARLVGRSWYVLETAIQDHRFGTVPTSEVGTPTSDVGAEPVISSTWESPRYESSNEELLPSVNRLRAADMEENNEEIKDSERLQDTWKTWFDRIADKETVVPTIEEIMEEEKPVNVPIHSVYREPPEELLPRRSKNEEENEPVVVPKEKPKENKTWSKTSIMTMQVFSVLVAVIVASLAVIGSGYLDKYVISISQVRIIAGVGLYNK